MRKRLPFVVEQISQIPLSGNVIPHTWYQHPLLRTEAGTVNLPAIILLAEFVYWHRWREERNEWTGEVTGRFARYTGPKYRAHYESLAKRHGMTKRQVKESVAFLYRQGIIEREVNAEQDVNETTTFYGLVFITPIPAAIIALNTIPEGGVTFKCQGGDSLTSGGVTFKCQQSETTNENTKNTSIVGVDDSRNEEAEENPAPQSEQSPKASAPTDIPTPGTNASVGRRRPPRCRPPPQAPPWYPVAQAPVIYGGTTGTVRGQPARF